MRTDPRRFMKLDLQRQTVDLIQNFYKLHRFSPISQESSDTKVFPVSTVVSHIFGGRSRPLVGDSFILHFSYQLCTTSLHVGSCDLLKYRKVIEK